MASSSEKNIRGFLSIDDILSKSESNDTGGHDHHFNKNSCQRRQYAKTMWRNDQDRDGMTVVPPCFRNDLFARIPEEFLTFFVFNDRLNMYNGISPSNYLPTVGLQSQPPSAAIATLTGLS